MNHSLLIAATATAMVLAGCSSASPRPVRAPTHAQAAPTSTAPPAPRPKGENQLRCDYTLELDANDHPDYHFIAGGTVSNTGNVGIVVRVAYKWRLLGSGSVIERRDYRVRVGATRDVDVRIPVTQTQVEAHQSAGAKCSTSATIISVFR